MIGLDHLFWAKVQITDTCWLWTGATQSKGYGSFGVHGRTYLAHRLAYEAMVGPIPDELTIDHLCRVKTCVRPSHLEPVTVAENNTRAAIADRRVCRHCSQPLVKKAGDRQYRCRPCESLRRWYADADRDRAAS